MAFLHAEVHQTRNERLWVFERFQHLFDSEALVFVYIKSLVATDHMIADFLVTLTKEASLSDAIRQEEPRHDREAAGGQSFDEKQNPGDALN